MSTKDCQQNIRVAVRCRPLNKNEQDKGVGLCIECNRDKVTVKERNSSKVFTFDHVFNQFSKQIDVYKSMVAPIIDEVLMGYNCTIFAYGQTGSGKTFTMTGERSDKLRYAWETDPLAGIIPRALSHLFETLQSSGSDFSVRVSFLEVYNEELFDLLASSEEITRLTIYDDANKKGSVIIKGLREVVVLDKDNVYSVIERGLSRRQTASTLLNAQSSRSHSIFTVTVHMKEIHPTSNEELLRIGKLHLVDLAGSENVGRSGAINQRAREAGSINQSLLTLGRVITALVDHTPHIPYRESKLTRLLQDSLGGRTKTSIIATISPSMTSLEETLSTLDYAHRAKNIQNKPEINARLNKNDMIRSYNEELERLRRDLEATRSKTGVFIDEENYQTLLNQIQQQRTRISDLEERREILEQDLTNIQELFAINQSELAEAKECKEKVEMELLGCQTDLEKLRVRFLKLKSRYEETDYLRLEHSKTESVLRKQAETLLNTTQIAIGDVDGLHDKVERLNDLDQSNRERLVMLPKTWLPDHLSSPLNEIQSLSSQVQNFCQLIRNTLSEMRSSESEQVNKLLVEQEKMRQILATRLADECIDAADRTDQFVTEQATTAHSCREQVLVPQFAVMRTCHTNLLESLDELKSQMLDQHQFREQSSQKLSSLVGYLDQLAKNSANYLEKEEQFSINLQKKLTHFGETTETMFQNLNSQLEKLHSEFNVQHQVLNSQLAEHTSRLQHWSQLSTTDLNYLKSNLSELQQSSQSYESDNYNQNQNHLNTINQSLDQIDQLRTILETKVDACLQTMHKEATRFASRGLGADLRQRASIWKTHDPEPAIKHASVELDQLVQLVKTNINQSLEYNTTQLLAIENRTGDVSVDANMKFAEIHQVLTNLPTDLQNRVGQDLLLYTPTGQTPQRRTFDYPTDLAKTGPYRHILKDFRTNRKQQSADQIALTPLPDNGDSLLDTSCSTAARDDSYVDLSNSGMELKFTEDKENMARTSGFVSSATSATGVVTESTSPDVLSAKPLVSNQTKPQTNVAKKPDPVKIQAVPSNSTPNSPKPKPPKHKKNARKPKA